MRDEDRGKILNRARAKQLNDLTGLRFGTISPTDVDALLDFGNEKFVFIEGKHVSAQMPEGQEWALTRIARACQRGGVPTLLIEGEHDTPICKDVDFAAMSVRRWYYDSMWYDPKNETVRELIERFLRWHASSRCRQLLEATT